MIAIIDYAVGNLQSVINAFTRLGVTPVVTDDPAVIREASHVVLPGVGDASVAIRHLRERGLEEVVKSLTQPVLGICVGMQILCQSSEEGHADCMGVFPTLVRKLDPLAKKEKLKIPHIGWNKTSLTPSPLFEGLDTEAYFYYVHSYAADPCPHTIGQCEYGRPFSAILHQGNFYGAQFHPEKSGKNGEILLANFLKL